MMHILRRISFFCRRPEQQQQQRRRQGSPSTMRRGRVPQQRDIHLVSQRRTPANGGRS